MQQIISRPRSPGTTPHAVSQSTKIKSSYKVPHYRSRSPDRTTKYKAVHLLIKRGYTRSKHTLSKKNVQKLYRSYFQPYVNLTDISSILPKSKLLFETPKRRILGINPLQQDAKYGTKYPGTHVQSLDHYNDGSVSTCDDVSSISTVDTLEYASESDGTNVQNTGYDDRYQNILNEKTGLLNDINHHSSGHKSSAASFDKDDITYMYSDQSTSKTKDSTNDVSYAKQKHNNNNKHMVDLTYNNSNQTFDDDRPPSTFQRKVLPKLSIDAKPSNIELSGDDSFRSKKPRLSRLYNSSFRVKFKQTYPSEVVISSDDDTLIIDEDGSDDDTLPEPDGREICEDIIQNMVKIISDEPNNTDSNEISSNKPTRSILVEKPITGNVNSVGKEDLNYLNNVLQDKSNNKSNESKKNGMSKSVRQQDEFLPKIVSVCSLDSKDNNLDNIREATDGLLRNNSFDGQLSLFEEIETVDLKNITFHNHKQDTLDNTKENTASLDVQHNFSKVDESRVKINDSFKLNESHVKINDSFKPDESQVKNNDSFKPNESESKIHDSSKLDESQVKIHDSSKLDESQMKIHDSSQLDKSQVEIIEDTSCATVNLTSGKEDKLDASNCKTFISEDRSFKSKDKSSAKKDKTSLDEYKSSVKKGESCINDDKSCENKDTPCTDVDKSYINKDKSCENKDTPCTDVDKSYINKDKSCENNDTLFTDVDKSYTNKDKSCENKDKPFTDVDKSYTKKDKSCTDGDKLNSKGDNGSKIEETTFSNEATEQSKQDKASVTHAKTCTTINEENNLVETDEALKDVYNFSDDDLINGNISLKSNRNNRKTISDIQKSHKNDHSVHKKSDVKSSTLNDCDTVQTYKSQLFGKRLIIKKDKVVPQTKISDSNDSMQNSTTNGQNEVHGMNLSKCGLKQGCSTSEIDNCNDNGEDLNNIETKAHNETAIDVITETKKVKLNKSPKRKRKGSGNDPKGSENDPKGSGNDPKQDHTLKDASSEMVSKTPSNAVQSEAARDNGTESPEISSPERLVKEFAKQNWLHQKYEMDLDVENDNYNDKLETDTDYTELANQNHQNSKERFEGSRLTKKQQHKTLAVGKKRQQSSSYLKETNDHNIAHIENDDLPNLIDGNSLHRSPTSSTAAVIQEHEPFIMAHKSNTYLVSNVSQLKSNINDESCNSQVLSKNDTKRKVNDDSQLPTPCNPDDPDPTPFNPDDPDHSTVCLKVPSTVQVSGHPDLVSPQAAVENEHEISESLNNTTPLDKQKIIFAFCKDMLDSEAEGSNEEPDTETNIMPVNNPQPDNERHHPKSISPFQHTADNEISVDENAGSVTEDVGGNNSHETEERNSQELVSTVQHKMPLVTVVTLPVLPKVSIARSAMPSQPSSMVSPGTVFGLEPGVTETNKMAHQTAPATTLSQASAGYQVSSQVQTLVSPNSGTGKRKADIVVIEDNDAEPNDDVIMISSENVDSITTKFPPRKKIRISSTETGGKDDDVHFNTDEDLNRLKNEFKHYEKIFENLTALEEQKKKEQRQLHIQKQHTYSMLSEIKSKYRCLKAKKIKTDVNKKPENVAKSPAKNTCHVSNGDQCNGHYIGDKEVARGRTNVSSGHVVKLTALDLSKQSTVNKHSVTVEEKESMAYNVDQRKQCSDDSKVTSKDVMKEEIKVDITKSDSQVTSKDAMKEDIKVDIRPDMAPKDANVESNIDHEEQTINMHKDNKYETVESIISNVINAVICIVMNDQAEAEAMDIDDKNKDNKIVTDKQINVSGIVSDKPASMTEAVTHKHGNMAGTKNNEQLHVTEIVRDKQANMNETVTNKHAYNAELVSDKQLNVTELVKDKPVNKIETVADKHANIAKILNDKQLTVTELVSDKQINMAETATDKQTEKESAQGTENQDIEALVQNTLKGVVGPTKESSRGRNRARRGRRPNQQSAPNHIPDNGRMPHLGLLPMNERSPNMSIDQNGNFIQASQNRPFHHPHPRYPQQGQPVNGHMFPRGQANVQYMQQRFRGPRPGYSEQHPRPRFPIATNLELVRGFNQPPVGMQPPYMTNITPEISNGQPSPSQQQPQPLGGPGISPNKLIYPHVSPDGQYILIRPETNVNNPHAFNMQQPKNAQQYQIKQNFSLGPRPILVNSQTQIIHQGQPGIHAQMRPPPPLVQPMYQPNIIVPISNPQSTTVQLGNETHNVTQGPRHIVIQPENLTPPTDGVSVSPSSSDQARPVMGHTGQGLMRVPTPSQQQIVITPSKPLVAGGNNNQFYTVQPQLPHGNNNNDAMQYPQISPNQVNEYRQFVRLQQQVPVSENVEMTRFVSPVAANIQKDILSKQMEKDRAMINSSTSPYKEIIKPPPDYNEVHQARSKDDSYQSGPRHHQVTVNDGPDVEIVHAKMGPNRARQFKRSLSDSQDVENRSKTKEVQTHKSVKQAKSKASKKLTCSNCGRDAIFVCSGCKRIPYCSEQCQNEKWEEHSNDCA